MLLPKTITTHYFIIGESLSTVGDLGVSGGLSLEIRRRDLGAFGSEVLGNLYVKKRYYPGYFGIGSSGGCRTA
jgi:hypothetical protein